MTTPIGSPDWIKPLPGGSQTLLNVSIPWLTTGSPYTSPWFDVTAFNGLYVVMGATSGLGDFGTMDIQYENEDGSLAIAGYEAIFRGTSSVQINAPVLGARARLVVTPGSIQNRATTLSVIGHGGGPSASVRGPGYELASFWSVPLAAGASSAVLPTTVVEGPGLLTVLATGQPARLQVQVFDAAGSNNHLVASLDVAANLSASAQIRIPPQQLDVVMINQGTALVNFFGSLWLARD